MRPFTALLLALICVPLLEVYLLISVGRIIGAIETLMVIVVTALLGAALLRWQGLTTFGRLRSTLDQGEIPAVELLEGLILLVTAALLLTPGFFTDAIGFACLIPAARRALARHVLDYLMQHAEIRGTVQGRIIPGDFRREDDDSFPGQR